MPLTLLTRAGEIVHVEDSAAAANQRIAILTVGHPYTVVGNSGANSGNLYALTIPRAKHGAAAWPDDR